MESPALDRRFRGIELFSLDVDGSAQFYCWLLGVGLPATATPEEAKAGVIALGIRRIHESAGDGPRGWVPVFSVDDVGAALARSGEDFRLGMAGEDIAYVVDGEGVWTGLRDSVAGEPGRGALGVDHCDYCAVDAARAAARLGRVLDLPWYRAIDDPAGLHVLFDGREVAAGMLQFAGSDVQPAWITYFAVGNVDESVARAVEVGSRVRVPPTDTNADRYAIVQDPFGQLFGLSCARQDASPGIEFHGERGDVRFL